MRLGTADGWKVYPGNNLSRRGIKLFVVPVPEKEMIIQTYSPETAARSIPLIFRTGVFQSLCFRGALLLLLLIVERSHADAHDYFAGLGKAGGAQIPQYVLILTGGTALFSFLIVLIKPTIGVMLAMLLFPFVTQDAEMTIPKLLASVLLVGFFVAWLTSKITLKEARQRRKGLLWV